MLLLLFLESYVKENILFVLKYYVKVKFYGIAARGSSAPLRCYSLAVFNVFPIRFLFLFSVFLPELCVIFLMSSFKGKNVYSFCRLFHKCAFAIFISFCLLVRVCLLFDVDALFIFYVSLFFFLGCR